MKRTKAWLGGAELNLAVPETALEQARGLLAYDGPEDGMLFDFGPRSQVAFHSIGLREPLLIAFFGDEGEYVDAGLLKPGTPMLRARQPYRYALELRGRYANQDAVTVLRNVEHWLKVT